MDIPETPPQVAAEPIEAVESVAVPDETVAPAVVPDEQPAAEEPAAEEPAAEEPVEEEEETKAETPEPAADAEEEDQELDDEDDEEGQVINTTRKFPDKVYYEDSREHLNVVFIGHVDAGKSTLAGNVLCMTGQVDERTIAKYERESKELNRGSWFLAFIMDTNEEERAKGKTVEVGRAHFESAKKRFTVLDAPGHKNYVPNMIGGAAQADVGILVISARKGEFETGFEGGGQTREHTTLAKTLGVRRLIVAVNKMDECQWGQGRFAEIQKKLSPFLRSVGYNPKTDVFFVPLTALNGENIKDPLPAGVAPWYKGPTLLQLLDDLEPLNRNDDGPLRLPVIDRYRLRGNLALTGKIESGTLKKGQKIVCQPNSQVTEVAMLELDQGEVLEARCGENVTVSLKDAIEVSQGMVVCSPGDACPVVQEFEAQLAILDLLPSRSIMSAGYTAMLHIHTATEEVVIEELLSEINRKTKKPSRRPPTFVQKGAIVQARMSLTRPLCIELFTTLQQLGRFTLRDEGKTIAIGKVTQIAQ